MTPKLLQLYAMRAQLEAIISAEELELGAVQQAAGCPHPEDKRVNSTTMGGGKPRFYCTVCREQIEGVA